MGSDRRRRVVTPDEARLWRHVTRDARPLGDAPPPPEAETPPDPAPAAASPPLPAIAPPRPASPTPAPPLQHGTVIGLDKRSAERMRRGRMEIEARIDLHGMTQEAAHAALHGFLGRSVEAGRRCLLVITGKGSAGTGVLRAAVPRWLNEPGLRRYVLAFSYAQARDGGEGALYVLLKRRR